MPCGSSQDGWGSTLTAHLGAGLLHQLQQRGAGLGGAAVDERRAERLEVRLQRLEAVHQPPPAAAARLKLALLLRRPDERRHLRPGVDEDAHLSSWAVVYMRSMFITPPGLHDVKDVSRTHNVCY